MKNTEKNPVPNKKLLLIINPVSGKKIILKHISEIIDIFQRGGYLTTVLQTSAPDDASIFASTLGNDYDVVVCTGGDGTLNETVTGFAKAGIRVPLGYIPCGSTNDFAAAHHLSVNIPTAAAAIMKGKITQYDIGQLGSDYFTYVAAFGSYSWLSYTTDQNLKNMLGLTAYILEGVKDLPKIKPIHMSITVDGVLYEDEYLFGAICNSLSIAGIFKLPEDFVNTNDGMFEVILVRNPKSVLDVNSIVTSLLHQDYPSENILLLHGKNIHIENHENVEFALDGEKSGRYSSFDINILPSFLSLLG